MFKQKFPVLIDRVEDLGRALNVEWKENTKFPMNILSPEKRVQFRDAYNFESESRINEFALQIESQNWPPIIVSKDGWLIDGNGRVGARLKQGHSTISAVVFQMDYETAPPEQRSIIHSWSAEENQKNGVRLQNASERRKAAEEMIRIGKGDVEISTALAVSKSTASNIRSEMKAAEMLKLAGHEKEDIDEIKGDVKRVLASPKIQNLHEAPKKRFIKLAVKAKLTPSEIKKAAAELASQPSDEDAGQRLTELEKKYKSRTTEIVGPPPKGIQVLKEFLSIPIDKLIVLEEAYRAEYIDAIREAKKRLEDLEEIQSGIKSTMEAA